MQISYAICAHNEHRELSRLLNLLDANIRDEDEVVIQLDTTATEEVKQVCYRYPAFTLIEFPLNRDFASFKNNLKANCNGDWVFQIDADEYFQSEFIEVLPQILDQNNRVEVMLLPRINTVEGLTQNHINKWGWIINEKGWVNFPDFQSRILQNKSHIKWSGKVHEALTGYTSYLFFPEEADYCILHNKQIERQEKQNKLYNSL
jgi:glycosyltransferase involved in cell wall biosynthesis